MEVGKYAGTPVDQLPNSYLRWIVMQDFEPEILDAAKEKLSQSSFDNNPMDVSRHALDMFSIRFIDRWVASDARAKDRVGFATYVTVLAQSAWEHGEDVSKNRHQDDGIAKEENGIIFVFKQSARFPEYKALVTVMAL